jgi:hypothetical protein
MIRTIANYLSRLDLQVRNQTGLTDLMAENRPLLAILRAGASADVICRNSARRSEVATLVRVAVLTSLAYARRCEWHEECLRMPVRRHHVGKHV